jgi:hypothetical protein
MKTSEFKKHLNNHSEHELHFVLPEGDRVPVHAHITEAGRVDKAFVDCGGTVRKVSSATLQAWVGADVDHRLSPGKLARVLEIAAPLFDGDDLDIEIEYEHRTISQFPVISVSERSGILEFELGSKHTDCLARETCSAQSDGCCSGNC